MRSNGRKNCYLHSVKLVMCAMLIFAVLCGCSKGNETLQAKTNSLNQSGTQNTATEAEPITLEQALLKSRGIPFDRSDYKKFVGGEDIITEYAEFDCNLDHGYSKDINDLLVAGGKLYQANFNSALVNGKIYRKSALYPEKMCCIGA